MWLVDFYQLHPMWTWLAIAAVILAVEIITGSGWLLWTAACAAAVGLIAVAAPWLGLPGELIVFSVLTVATSLTARRYLKKRDIQPGPDINDRARSLIGQKGRVIEAASGRLRVLVDGSEWDAETEAEGLTAGAQVRVTKVLGGARIAVETL